MPLTEYDNLTGEQKISVTKMYADLSDLRDYLYDWDDKGYHGRRPKPKLISVIDDAGHYDGEETEEVKPVDATDAAVKLAEEHDIDLAEVEGTGADGRILLSDVRELID